MYLVKRETFSFFIDVTYLHLKIYIQVLEEYIYPLYIFSNNLKYLTVIYVLIFQPLPTKDTSGGGGK